MIRHLARLAWNRKGSHALVILEVLLAFLVVFAVCALGLFLAGNARRPLGYTWQDVWNVSIDPQQMTDDRYTEAQLATFARVVAEAAALPGVTAAGAALSAPFELGGSNTSFDRGGRQVSVDVNEATDGLDEVLGLDIVAGRWFDASDDGPSHDPVVINESLARALFGGEDPLGQTLNDASPGRPAERVVGVVRDFREDGELAAPGHYLFRRSVPGHPRSRLLRNVLVRVPPGTTDAFEEELVERLSAVAPEWSFEVEPLAEMRRSAFRLRLAPLLLGGVVAGSLLLMVALGLSGVLWQNVTRRTRELGLRRAVGASARAVEAQLLGEVAVMTTLATLIGVLLVVQIPILELAGALRPGLVAAALLLALAVVHLATLASALYPAWMATRMQPAEALHHE